MNKIRSTFKQERSDRSHLAACKSVVKKGLCALALTGLSLPFANSAFALSAGCSQLNIFSGTSDGVQVSSAFSANEVAKVTFTHVAPASTVNYSFTYTDNDDAANSQTITTGSSENGDTITLSFEIPADTTNGVLFFQGVGASYNMTGACALKAEPAASSSASTSSAVINAVSRSQTTVIQQNIAARIASLSDNTANTDLGNSSIGGPGTIETDNTNLVDMPLKKRKNSITDSDDALRRMAMMGSFDSSTGQGMNLLGLGPTDQGDTGGASGIDGRAAFATTSPFTVWGHGSFTSVDNDHVNGTTDSRYDGDVWGYNIGLDYRFADALIAGLSLGYNDTDLTTSFNNGSYQETGWVASPYVIYRPIENLTIAGEAGYGMGNIDVTRDNGAVSGTTESDMWYAALTTSYRTNPIKAMMAASLTPSLAFIAARKTVDAYTESNGTANATTRSNTRQIKPAIEAAYDFTPTQSLIISPFIETGLIHDFTDEINNDKTAFNIGGGVRLSDNLTGLNAALEGNYLAGRADYTEYTIGSTVTYGFTLTGDDGRAIGIVKPFFASNLNEYGNQRIRTGLGFDTGPLTSELALSHMLSIANDDDDNTDTSRLEIQISMPF
ncbi:autotransporter outer membrane beta-barrel domain-containing protein [Thalassospira xiamenensis]|uniref:autotransporter outer membrane beta-barrel domain-containing protein n=1 Tax=Thalassospira xiamenensis TaxID=220697 RepID=UPI001FFE828F|nr:autotransporter outer membrane beta-barrel domain-containing protein [Thalassospira xiamenensis]MCK2165854.1 autotransporter outer membrane beta-barrel domain-containing protein [Thalassospira xiamenensis]